MNRNRQNPNLYEAFLYAPNLCVADSDQVRQNRDLRRLSRRYLYPLIRVVSIPIIKIIIAIKRLIPKLGSEWALNKLGVWFIKRMLSPEAGYYFIQHFHIESNIINFISSNCDSDNIEKVALYPRTIDDLGEHLGVNAILQHDINLYNAVLDIGLSKHPIYGQNQKNLDYSMLIMHDIEVDEEKDRIVNLDMDSGLYIMAIFMALFFTDKQIELAITSLQFDESLLVTLAKLTGSNRFLTWTPMKFTNWLGYTSDPVRDLRWHMMTLEYAHNHLLQLRSNSETPL